MPNSSNAHLRKDQRSIVLPTISISNDTNRPLLTYAIHQSRLAKGLIQLFSPTGQSRLTPICRFLAIFVYFGCIFLVAGCEDPEAKYQSLMVSAENYFQEEKFNEARIQLQAAIDIKPKSAEAYFQLAETLIRLQKIREAVEAYNTTINYDPAHRKARLHVASIMLAGRQYELAESHVTTLLEANADDSEALLIRANIEGLGPRKKYDVAKKILDGILSKEPENLIALASLANLELSNEKPQEAEALFTKALKISPKNPPLQMALADLFSRQGRLDEAQEILESLVTAHPEESGLRYVMGEFLLRRGLGDAALEQYKETLVKEPARHIARDRLYDMYLTRKEEAQARALTADLVAKLPNDPAISYFKGRDSELDNKPQEALTNFLEAIKLLNNFSPAFRRAGLIELQTGKEREGTEHLNQAIALDPGDIGARLALARVYFIKQDLAQATEHLNRILQLYPRQLGANILSADIALIEGETDKARKVYEFLVKAFPKSPLGYFKLGMLEEKEGNLDKSLELYEKTIAFDRDILAPSRRLVAVLGKKQYDVGSMISELKKLKASSKNSQPEFDLLIGSLTLADAEDPQRFETARLLFLKALEGNPNLIGAYFALGAIDSVSGDIESAAVNYGKLLEKNPQHPPTQMLLALARERQGRFDDAAKVYRDLLAYSPRFGPAANNLSWLLVEELNGNLDEALTLAEIAKEQLPKESSVADTLGWVHYRRGSQRVALPIVEEAIELHKAQNPNQPVNPEILFHLAEIQSSLELPGAKATIKEAIDLAGEKHPKYEKMKALAEKVN